MTDALWATLVEVNDAVNASVEHRTDLEMWGEEERWSYPDRHGDTEDFVLEKRRRLMATGIAAGSLLIAVARNAAGDGHALLAVRTSKGDFILDDAVADVLPWRETGYTFLKIQSPTRAALWLAVE